MITRIVGFGCSWIHGDEIEHPTAEPGTKPDRVYRETNCTLGQFARLAGIQQVENYGIGGGSLQSTQWEFGRWAQRANNKNTLVVIGLTEASRMSWWNGPNKHKEKFGGRYMHNHWIYPGHPWEQFVKFYYGTIDEHKLWANNYWNAVTFFSNYCSVNDTPLFMFNVFPAPCDMEEVVDPGWNARGYMHKIQYEQGNVLAPGKHPNEKGSIILAERLYNMAKDAKLIQ